VYGAGELKEEEEVNESDEADAKESVEKELDVTVEAVDEEVGRDEETEVEDGSATCDEDDELAQVSEASVATSPV